MEGDKPKRRRFKHYPIGFLHIDIAEAQTAEGKLFLFAPSTARASSPSPRSLKPLTGAPPREFLECVPYQIHTILTDNGIQFAEQPRNRNTIYSGPMRFDMICATHGIEHRPTAPNHPCTNAQVERVNRTIKYAAVKRYHYDDHAQLRVHLAACNFARRLKTFGGLTPYEYI